MVSPKRAAPYRSVSESPGGMSPRGPVPAPMPGRGGVYDGDGPSGAVRDAGFAPPDPKPFFSSSVMPPNAPSIPVASEGRKIVDPGPFVIAGNASMYLSPSRYIAA